MKNNFKKTSIVGAGLLIASIYGVGVVTALPTPAFAEENVIVANQEVREAWVSNNGSDTAAGTQEAPFASLSKAIATVGAGGKVHVSGIYVAQSDQQNVFRPTAQPSNDAVTIVGDAGSELVIRGNQFELNQPTTFENLKLTFRTDGSFVPSIYTNGYNVTMNQVDTTGSMRKPNLVIGTVGEQTRPETNTKATIAISGGQSTEFNSIFTYNPNGQKVNDSIDLTITDNVKVTEGISANNDNVNPQAPVKIQTGSNFIRTFDGGANPSFDVTFLDRASLNNVNLINVNELNINKGAFISVAEDTPEFTAKKVVLGGTLNLEGVDTSSIDELQGDGQNGEASLRINVQNPVTLKNVTGSVNVLVNVPYSYNPDNARSFLNVTEGKENIAKVETSGKPNVEATWDEASKSWKVQATNNPVEDPEDGNDEDGEEPTPPVDNQPAPGDNNDNQPVAPAPGEGEQPQPQPQPQPSDGDAQPGTPGEGDTKPGDGAVQPGDGQDNPAPAPGDGDTQEPPAPQPQPGEGGDQTAPEPEKPGTPADPQPEIPGEGDGAGEGNPADPKPIDPQPAPGDNNDNQPVAPAPGEGEQPQPQPQPGEGDAEQQEGNVTVKPYQPKHMKQELPDTSDVVVSASSAGLFGVLALGASRLFSSKKKK